jgi:hypothetical protein
VKTKNISGAIATGAIIILMCVMSVLIIESIFSDSIFANIASSGSVTNETLSAVDNVTNSTLGIISTIPTSACSLSAFLNSTSGSAVPSSNYTFYGDDCIVILKSPSAYIGKNINATYTYSYYANNTLSGLNVEDVKQDFGLFITGVLGFLAIIGTLLGILWVFNYIKPMFSKEEGLASMTA